MRTVKRVLVIALLLLAVVYAIDYFMARGRPLGAVQVQPYYAVPQKNGHTEFILADPETDDCVQSMLPHLGYSPCWYLGRHKQKRIDM